MSVPFSKIISERINWIQRNLNFLDKEEITIEEVRDHMRREVNRMLVIPKGMFTDHSIYGQIDERAFKSAPTGNKGTR